MSNPLDRKLEHYLDAILKNSRLKEADGTSWQAFIESPFEITASSDSDEGAVANLRAAVKSRVFSHMIRNQELPVISGIDINPGSC
jgi:hypothetical protein